MRTPFSVLVYTELDNGWLKFAGRADFSNEELARQFACLPMGDHREIYNGGELIAEYINGII
jgi:hypothetical protein